MKREEEERPARLIVQNMVCDRCRTAVQRVLDRHGAPWSRVALGEVELHRPLDDRTAKAVRHDLRREGFDLVDERTAQLILRVKDLIVGLIHRSGMVVPRAQLPAILGKGLNREYAAIATAFSRIEGITVEQYFLLQRIERVKELVRYGELTMLEIAERTGFSSVAHLSTQFKKLTGMSPTTFKALRPARGPM